jgi:HAD superfamily hydrolase (TIGR01509 family)
MDGTLIDSEGLWLQAEITVMTELGASWSDEDQAHCLGGPLERVVDYMLERGGGSQTAAHVTDRLLDTMEAHFRESPLSWRPGARALLAEARKRRVPTALVSASWNRLIDAVSDKIDEDLGTRAFDVVVAGDDVTHSKPHPEPYQTAAGLLGFNPKECLALEDSPTGVSSATSAGCRVVAIPHIAEIEAHGALVIDTLEGWTLDALWAAVPG